MQAQQLSEGRPGCQWLSAAQYVETDMQQLQLRQRHDPRQAQEAIEAQVISSSASEPANHMPGRTSDHVRHRYPSGSCLACALSRYLHVVIIVQRLAAYRAAKLQHCALG